MQDAAGPLGDAQHEVPVLRALELGAEAADLAHERPAQHAEVAGVHLRAEPLGRPVGLEEGAEVAPLLVDLVLVGVDVVRRRLGPQRGVDLAQGVRVELVVVVEQGDELTEGRGEPVVRGGDDAAVLGAPDEPDARVLPLGLLQDGEDVRRR